MQCNQHDGKDPTKAFIVAATVYLVIGGALGVGMASSAVGGSWTSLDYYLLPSHTHLMLLGWVSMTMFGVAYRMFPAFLMNKLYSMKLAWLHFLVANVALIGMASFFFLNRLQEGRWTAPLAVAGSLQYVGILIFAYNIWRTARMETPRKTSMDSRLQLSK